MYQQYKDAGFIVITLLIQNNESEPPTQEELMEWASKFGQTFPVVTDVNGDVAMRFAQRETLALPSHSLIAPGGEVLIADDDVTEEDIVASLP